MPTSSNVRVASIALTLAIAVGIGLFLEYDARSLAPASAPPRAVERPAATPQPRSNGGETAAPPIAEPAYMTTFKCTKNGRVSFSDRPCAAGETLLGTSTSVASPPRDTQTELVRTQAVVARMQAEHQQREAALVSVMPTTPDAPPAAKRKVLCNDIDREIAGVDAALRQPHSAEWGDYLTGERRKLTDRRFSIGC